MLIKLENGNPTGHPVAEENFRQLFPNTSFPWLLTPADVEPFGFGMYDFTFQPEPGKYEKVVEVLPVKDAQGIYRQTWSVLPMSAGEKAQADAQKTDQVRAERNSKLAATDWTQLADAPVDHAAWAAYRQDLRDVTSQPGFPWDVNWPTQPE
jgi:hypothetical protein